jgi:glutathione peroxidase-family protein
MGNSGLTKLTSPGDFVETPFKSALEARVLDLERNEVPLAFFGGYFLLVLNAGSHHSKAAEHLRSVRELAQAVQAAAPWAKVQVVVCPSNQFGNETGRFPEIQQRYKELLGDAPNILVTAPLDVNGRLTHPLFRFLRKRSSLFDFQLSTARPLPSDFCKFLLDPNGQVLQFIPGSDDSDSALSKIKEVLNQYRLLI